MGLDRTAADDDMEGDVSLTIDPGRDTPCDADVAHSWRIVHDFCFSYGGAERVTSVLAARVLPGAPVHCLAGDDPLLERMVPDRRVTRLFPRGLTSARAYRLQAPVMAAELVRRRPLPGNLLASSYAVAHHVPVEGDVVVYCHSPLRQLWSDAADHQLRGGLPQLALRAVGPGLRRLDRRAAERATRYIASSEHVRDRIRRAYGRVVVPVVPPPVEQTIARARSLPPREDWVLYAGRLVEPYKRVSLLIDAVRDTDLRLVIVGDGRDGARLRASAPPNVTFVGSVTTAA